MAEMDISRIRVGDCSVGIIGLKQLMEEMSETYADRSDEEIEAFMLKRLGSSNYIPTTAEKEYATAFVREFRKHLGQPYTDHSSRGLEVKVLGAGCTQCRQLTRTIMEMLTELKIPAGVDHITDLREIAGYGVMGSPALVIDGKIMAVGSVPPRGKIKQWLADANRSSRSN